jgi:hypothetical protein
MKNLNFLLLPFVLILFACGGSEEATTDEHTDLATDTTSVDTIVVTLTFDEYVAEVNELKPSVENLDTSFALFEENKASFTTEEKDSACVLYISMIDKVAYNFGDIEDNSEEGYMDLVAIYEPYGYKIGGGEGMLWLIPNYSVVGERFKDDLTLEYYEYLRLGEITGKQYSADAGMLISYKEWGDVLVELEDRARANKDSKFFSEFIRTYNDYLFWYMWGMDNTPITNWGEPGLNEEVKTEYSRMIAKENGTGRIIEQHLSNLEANNYSFSWDDQWKLTEEEIVNYFNFSETAE